MSKDAGQRLQDIYDFLGDNFSAADVTNVRNAVNQRYADQAQRDFVSNSLSLGRRFWKKAAETERRVAVRAVGLVTALVQKRPLDREDAAAIVADKRTMTKAECIQELTPMLVTLRPVTRLEVQNIAPTKTTQDPRLQPSFNQANSKEKRYAIDAIEAASKILGKTWPILSGVRRNPGFQAQFELYFGSPFDVGRYNTVKANIKRIYDVVCSQSLFLYYRVDKMAGRPDDTPGAGGGATIPALINGQPLSNIFAYVLNPSPGPGTHVYLCGQFFEGTHLKDRHQDQIGGVVIHELSHALCGTRDHAYGDADCRALPVHQMVENADTYEYYCEQYG